MFPNVRELGWALAGNLVIGIGAGTATLAAFAPQLPVVDGGNPVVRVGVVSAGFAVFFAGYGVSQTGTYRDPGDPLVPSVSSSDTSSSTSGSVDPFLAVRGLCLLLGLIGLGTGMRLFALTISGWDARLGAATGVVCILGYIFGHIGINGGAL